MKNRVKWVAIVLFAGAMYTGLSALLATPASAASQCWQVDCNTCCRIGGGKVICTQRACV
jgi:hypothetical protein